MKQRFEPSSDLDPLEEANNRFVAESMPASPMKEMGDAIAAENAGQFGDSETSRVVKPTKSNVTKEQLAKSGYDNLRDYLNAQQGLTRRGESAPTPVKATPVKAEPAKAEPATPPAAKQKPAAETKSKTNMTLTPANTESRRTFSEGAGKIVSGAASGIVDYLSSLKSPSERKAQNRKMEKLKADPTSRERDFAKGGKVSASSRGDGIAQRGKTRGKMC